MPGAVDVRNPRFELRVVTHNDTGELVAEDLRASVLSITTQRRLHEPAGAFQIVLVPRRRALAGGGVSSWHDVFQPMDWIELALWVPPRERHVVMRGFLDVIEERFQIEGGTPQHRVILRGRDYGKLPLITKIYFQHALSQQLELFKRWRSAWADIFEWGTRPNTQDPALPGEPNLPTPASPADPTRYYKVAYSPGELLRRIWRAFMEPRLDELFKLYAGDVPRPALAFEEPKDDAILKTFDPVFVHRAIAPYVDLWTLLQRYAHAPWREFYFEDRPESPTLVYRPTPWLDLHGDWIQGSVVGTDDAGTPILGAPASVQTWALGDDDLIDFGLSRSEGEIANFIVTLPQGFDQIVGLAEMYPKVYEGVFLAADSSRGATNTEGPGGLNVGGPGPQVFKGNPFLVDADDHGYRLHGLRVLKQPSLYFDVERRDTAEGLRNRIKALPDQAAAANLQLARALDHASWLEFGHLTIKGDERIRPGSYVALGPTGARYYVDGVIQQFRQGTGPGDGSFRTVLEVSRGRGHLVRAVGGRP